MCTNERLVDGIPVTISSLSSNEIFVLGHPHTASFGSLDVYESRGLRLARNLSSEYAPQQQTRSAVGVNIQGRRFISQAVDVSKRDAVSISAVLRTPNTWVDRIKVRLAYQVKDVYGSAVVRRPTQVMMQLGGPVSGSASQAIHCSTQFTQVPPYVDHCSATALPSAWFTTATRSSYITISLISDSVSKSIYVGLLTLRAIPSWWDAALQTATVGNGLSAPVGVSSGGIFASLPTSPVHAGEIFYVHVYAHTAGLSLSAWRVRLHFSASLLQFTTFAQNSHFNSATLSISPGEVTFLATGVRSTTSIADVTGTAIYLLRASLSLDSTVDPGAYDSEALGLYPRATELISGGVFVQDKDGQVFDGRNGVHNRGRLVVASCSSAAAIFISSPGGVLPNVAPLTGAETSYALSVVQVSDDDRYERDTRQVTLGTVCSTGVGPSVLALSGCNILLGATQLVSQSNVTINVEYAGVTATAYVDIYTPQHTSILLSDSTLNQFASNRGEEISPCGLGASAMYPYQRTQAVAYADGLDATPLVSFEVANTSVADVSSTRPNIIQGKQPGSTLVYYGGRAGVHPESSLVVSHTHVTATELIARVVTSVAWSSS